MENEQTKAFTEQLRQKLLLLEKITANTKTMVCFARQRKLKGLLRLLREREMELEALTRLNAQLDALPSSKRQPELASEALLGKIKKQEQELAANDAILTDAAHGTRKAISDDMRRVQEQRKVRNNYDLQDIKMAGRRINYYK